MKIALYGATGMIGKRILDEALRWFAILPS